MRVDGLPILFPLFNLWHKGNNKYDPSADGSTHREQPTRRIRFFFLFLARARNSRAPFRKWIHAQLNVATEAPSPWWKYMMCHPSGREWKLWKRRPRRRRRRRKWWLRPANRRRVQWRNQLKTTRLDQTTSFFFSISLFRFPALYYIRARKMDVT